MIIAGMFRRRSIAPAAIRDLSVWNPNYVSPAATTALTGRQLRTLAGTGQYANSRSFDALSGNVYFDSECILGNSNNFGFGVADGAVPLNTNTYVGAGNSIGLWYEGRIYVNGGAAQGGIPVQATQRIQIAVRTAQRRVWIRPAGGAWIGGGDPSLNTSPTAVLGGSADLFFAGSFDRRSGSDGNSIMEVPVASNLVSGTPPAGFAVGVLRSRELSLQGENWDDWVTVGGVQIATEGSPAAPCWRTPHNSYGMIQLPSFTTGRRVSFRVKPRSGPLSLGSFFFGCNSFGRGLFLRIDARGANCGIGVSTQWAAPPGPSQALSASLNTEQWYEIEIEMTAPNAGLWRLNGSVVGTFTGTIEGRFIAFSATADVFVTGPDWDTLLTQGGNAPLKAKIGEYWNLATSVTGSTPNRAFLPASIDPGSPITGGATPGLDFIHSATGAANFGNGPRGANDPAFVVAGGNNLSLLGGTAALPYAFTNAMSWCFFTWFRFETTATGCIMAIWDQVGPSTCSALIDVTSGQLRLSTGGSSYFNLFVPLPAAGAWHFLVAWRDNANGKTYLQINDGTVFEFSGVTSGEITFAGSFVLGNYPAGGGAFTGRLSRAGVVRGNTLTAAERSWLFNNGQGRDFSEL